MHAEDAVLAGAHRVVDRATVGRVARAAKVAVRRRSAAARAVDLAAPAAVAGQALAFRDPSHDAATVAAVGTVVLAVRTVVLGVAQAQRLGQIPRGLVADARTVAVHV